MRERKKVKEMSIFPEALKTTNMKGKSDQRKQRKKQKRKRQRKKER